jgi:hypothetical protein
MKMETVCFSETSARTDMSASRQNSEKQQYHSHRRENRKYHIAAVLFVSFFI